MINWKVGMTSKSSALTTRLLMLQWRIQRSDLARASGPLLKCVVVRIESATRLHEVESVIVDQNATVRYVPGPYTARHTAGRLKRSR